MKYNIVRDYIWSAFFFASLIFWATGVCNGSVIASYPLEKVSVFDLDEDMTGPYSYMIKGGQTAESFPGKADDNVKAYPSLKSARPLYGHVSFGMNYLSNETGTKYCFVIDESRGTSTGYDRMYFDANGDLDITNDPVCEAVEDSPYKGQYPGQQVPEVFFAPIHVKFDFGEGVGKKPVKIHPVYREYNQQTKQMFFSTDTAYSGKIKIDEKEHNVLVFQGHVITGRMDHPMTYLLFPDQREQNYYVGFMRYINGTFYDIMPSPTGESITVTPYSGDMGSMSVIQTVERQTMRAKLVPMGYLATTEKFVDVSDCLQNTGMLKLPSGDYRPLQIMAEVGNFRLSLSSPTARPGDENSGTVFFPIKIRKDKNFLLDLKDSPTLRFVSPTERQRYKPGDTVRLEGLFFEQTTGMQLTGVEDLTKPQGPTGKYPDGTSYKQCASIDPVVRILNSKGKAVTQGKMPFG